MDEQTQLIYVSLAQLRESAGVGVGRGVAEQDGELDIGGTQCTVGTLPGCALHPHLLEELKHVATTLSPGHRASRAARSGPVYVPAATGVGGRHRRGRQIPHQGGAAH
ncbi:hypothetical protein GCM10027615_28750 [Plantactinospora veratri]